jgi:L-lysine 6-transaminase
MTTRSIDSPTVNPAEVRRVLGRHLLVDGFHLVIDLERSQGSRIYDSSSDKWYLDFYTFFGSCPVGINHPKLRTAGFERRLLRAARNKPANSDIYSVEMAEFVETLERVAMPARLPHLFLIEGGALGVENALKAAFDWKVRRNFRKGCREEKGHQVLHFREAFHGRTGYTLSLTNTDPVKTDYFPKFRWPRVENPKLRFPVTPEVERDVAAAEQSALDQIAKAFADNPDDVAAVIIEPIQAEGGDNHFRPEFLQALQRAAAEHDAFFIVDEVQTGVGLTGKMWAHEHFGIVPDALAFGKKSQVCGCLIGPKVDTEPKNVFKVSSRINSTWGGGLTDMVRFARFLEIIDEERMVDNARVVGERLLAGLRQVQDELGGPMSNARGRGLMIAFDLPTPEQRAEAQKRIIEAGCLVLTCGERSIRFRPPLNLTAAEADAGLDMIRKALKTF